VQKTEQSKAKSKRVRVVIVDDSVTACRTLTRILEACPDIEVVGHARDPYEARDRILELHPDVITLDIEMPRMDGLSFLKRLMQSYPLPVVIVSSLTVRGSSQAIEALSQGAVEVMGKSGDLRAGTDAAVELTQKVMAASRARRRPLPGSRAPAIEHQLAGSVTRPIVAIGSSTGGTEALRVILEVMPPTCPCILIAQHMPALFTASFARHLDRDCEIEVREARDGDRIRPGLALLCPGDHHLSVQRRGDGFVAQVMKGPLINRHRPSVDVLFKSVARRGGSDAVGVILTGMGKDGAVGLGEMRQAGARTIAQDEASCVVFGMPQAAINLGAAEVVLPLQDISAQILRMAQSVAQRSPSPVLE
jgi:two-component system chemotaxis response regulator CheB